MEFAVLLTPEAETGMRQLLSIVADPARAIADLKTTASALRTDPYKAGESRASSSQRVIFVGSLLSLYLVDEATKTVFIVGIKNLVQ